jgi:hypothetical protein
MHRGETKYLPSGHRLLEESDAVIIAPPILVGG